MRRRDAFSPPGRRRPGKTLVMFALLLPVLLGLVGLVIDCGLLMAARRAAQNAADAAAMAAAMADLSGQGEPQGIATTFVNQYNLLPGATLSAFNSPPAAGPHAGLAHYYEVVVTSPVATLFMPVLGAGSSHSVQARAVAGYESVRAAQGLALLDPTASPGLAVYAGASLVVDGPIGANATSGLAAWAEAGSQVQAALYQIAGPSVWGDFNPYPGTPGKLSLDVPPIPDPLINLPTPATSAGPSGHTATPASPGWSTRALGSPTVQARSAGGLVPPNFLDADGTVQLYPGIYQSIEIGGGTVTFNPGVYVLSPGAGTDYALDVTGGDVTGAGVLFYNTGGNFVPSTGYPDSGDANLYSPGPSGINAPPSGWGAQGTFAGIRLDTSKGNQITFSPIQNDPVFSGVLYFQRRANLQPIEIAGGNLSLGGTIYAKWAPCIVSGGGSYPAQFVVGSLQVAGRGVLSVGYGQPFARAPEVFLVE